MQRMAAMMAILVGLTSCTLPAVKEAGIKADKTADDAAAIRDRGLERSQRTAQRPGYGSGFEVKDYPYLAATFVPNNSNRRLPDIDIDIAYAMAMPLTEIAAMISDRVGIPVTIGNFSGTGAAAGQQAILPALRLNFSGRLAALLDTIASRVNATWRYEEGRGITLYRYESRTYTIYSMPGVNAVELGVNAELQGSIGADGQGGSGGPTGSSTGTQKVTYKADGALNFWADIERIIRAALGPGSGIIPSAAFGTVTVVATPAEHEVIKGIIDEQNDRLSRVVEFEVRVLSVDLSSSDQINFNPGLLLRNRISGLQFSAAGPASLAEAAAGAISLGVTNPPAGSPVGALSGSNAVVNGLKQIGKVSTRYEVTQSTSSNRPVPIVLSSSRGYLKSVSSSLVSSAGSQQSITPGVVTTGFNMTLLPRVFSKGRLLVALKVDISEFKGFRTVSSGAAAGSLSIEVPEIDSRTLQQEVPLESGSTIILSGYDLDKADAVSRGFPTPDAPVLGGSQRGNQLRTLLVILITPYVKRSPLDLASTRLDD